MRGKEEMMESGSGSEQAEEKSGNEQEADQLQQPPKKKRYHRHTAHQIQEMEKYISSLSLSLTNVLICV